MKVAESAFFCYGQTLARPEYCLVEYTVLQRFIDELQKCMKEIYKPDD